MLGRQRQRSHTRWFTPNHQAWDRPDRDSWNSLCILHAGDRKLSAWAISPSRPRWTWAASWDWKQTRHWCRLQASWVAASPQHQALTHTLPLCQQGHFLTSITIVDIACPCFLLSFQELVLLSVLELPYISILYFHVNSCWLPNSFLIFRTFLPHNFLFLF